MKKILKYSIYIILFLLVAFGLYYKFWFLRLPERHIVANDKVFLAPANGKVASVSKWNKESLLITKKQFGLINVWTADVDTEGTMISIVMDVTNVHYQRLPLAGKLLNKKYTKGNFNNAVANNNDYGIRFENEHNEMLFETTAGYRYKLIQIAGLVARRIEDYVTPASEYKQGDVIGLIKLGSQVTVILPSNIKPNVKVGDITVDGQTIIGEVL
jgi:phosphatidylserine decarboxylase